jgi:TIR domain
MGAKVTIRAMDNNGRTKLEPISRASRSAGRASRRSERAGFRRRVLLVLLSCLVGVAGLAQVSRVLAAIAAIFLLLAVIVLGGLRLRKWQDSVPAWRDAAARRARSRRTSRIFISYRRDDAGSYARLLQVYLRERFPHAPVFMDLDSIEAGADFAEAIEAGVGTCCVMVALIGPRWLTLTDEEGQRRLDDEKDWVRFEIRAALERHVRVVPVLVDGAKMPREQQLPTDLRDLARLNALEMSHDRYEYDTSRLAAVIQRVLANRKR